MAAMLLASALGCAMPEGMPIAVWPPLPCLGSGGEVVGGPEGCPAADPACPLVYHRTQWRPLDDQPCPVPQETMLPAGEGAPRTESPTLPAREEVEEVIIPPPPEEAPLTQPPHALDEIPAIPGRSGPLPLGPTDPTDADKPTGTESPRGAGDKPGPGGEPPSKEQPTPREGTSPTSEPAPEKGEADAPALPVSPLSDEPAPFLPLETLRPPATRLPTTSSPLPGEGAALRPERTAPLRKLVLPALEAESPVASAFEPEPDHLAGAAPADPTD
ncbi:MAG: hypothetical protein JW809_20105 [Pirellulales bacterium]|nr:hypothetical protein [Pirellulales bacterium]